MESCTCSSVFSRSEFFFNPTLSSMMIADTPVRSNVFTVIGKCSIMPPVSPSTMMGFVVTSRISLMVFRREVKSTYSMSGFPFAVESVRLEIQIPSNSFFPFGVSIAVCSMISPETPLWASRMRTISLVLSNLRNRFWRSSDVVPTSRIAFLSKEEDIFLVYSGSINLPPHSARTSITFARVFFCTPVFQSSPWTTKSGLSFLRLGS